MQFSRSVPESRAASDSSLRAEGAKLLQI